jgi:hypothetical protein
MGDGKRAWPAFLNITITEHYPSSCLLSKNHDG